jgi:hypothetical protein
LICTYFQGEDILQVDRLHVGEEMLQQNDVFVQQGNDEKSQVYESTCAKYKRKITKSTVFLLIPGLPELRGPVCQPEGLPPLRLPAQLGDETQATSHK